MIAQRDNRLLTPACELCGQHGARRLWSLDLPGHDQPFQLWQCLSCGVVFNSPRLPAGAIRDQYDGGYYVFHETARRRWARATQLYIEHLLPLEAEYHGRCLLEVGSATGELLALARARGWQVQGVEISAEASEIARREYGLDVLAGTLEEHAASLEPFDVIIATDVIEHVPSPADFLVCMRGLLQPGGSVCLETPNWGGFWRHVGGRRWLGINRFHIFLFDASCLLSLMQQAGLRDCRARSSTNLGYTLWSSRPEIAGMLARLPASLRWRAERVLNRLTPRCPALDLQTNPPADLAAALTRIADVGEVRPVATGGLRGDNLAVIGRA